jgi:hypothetical protein
MLHKLSGTQERGERINRIRPTDRAIFCQFFATPSRLITVVRSSVVPLVGRRAGNVERCAALTSETRGSSIRAILNDSSTCAELS